MLPCKHTCSSADAVQISGQGTLSRSALHLHHWHSKAWSGRDCAAALNLSVCITVPHAVTALPDAAGVASMPQTGTRGVVADGEPWTSEQLRVLSCTATDSWHT